MAPVSPGGVPGGGGGAQGRSRDGLGVTSNSFHCPAPASSFRPTRGDSRFLGVSPKLWGSPPIPYSPPHTLWGLLSALHPGLSLHLLRLFLRFSLNSRGSLQAPQFPGISPRFPGAPSKLPIPWDLPSIPWLLPISWTLPSFPGVPTQFLGFPAFLAVPLDSQDSLQAPNSMGSSLNSLASLHSLNSLLSPWDPLSISCASSKPPIPWGPPSIPWVPLFPWGPPLNSQGSLQSPHFLISP